MEVLQALEIEAERLQSSSGMEYAPALPSAAAQAQHAAWARKFCDRKLTAAGLTSYEAGPGLAAYLTSPTRSRCPPCPHSARGAGLQTPLSVQLLRPTAERERLKHHVRLPTQPLP